MKIRKKNLKVKHLFSVISVLLILLLWQITSNSWGNVSFFPTPVKVFQELWLLIITKDTYIILFTTLSRLFFVVIVASIIGTLLGLMAGIHAWIEGLLQPIVIIFRTTPVISVVVILIMLYGNIVSLYIIVFLLLFPIIYQSELDGIKNINGTLLEVMKLDCDQCSIQSVSLVFFPLALPHLRTGILQSIGLGIKVLVMAEFIAQTKISIGREIQAAKNLLNYAHIFAWTIILVVLVLIVEHFVNKYMKYRYI